MTITVIRIALLYLIIMSGAIFYSDIFNKKVNKTIILSFLTIAMSMYVFALFNIMQIGFYIVSILVLSSGVYTTVKKIMNKEFKSFMKYNVLTSGALFFTILYIALISICYNKVMIDWDNYSYWSYYSKYYYFKNTINILPEYSMGINYPPFPIILEYFCLKVIGVYKQGIESFVLQMLAFSFFLPLFEKNKTILGKVFAGLSMIILPATFISILFYDSAYADSFLAFSTGYVFYTYLMEKDKKFLCFELSLILSTLAITKGSGIGYAVIIIICLFIYELIMKDKNKQLKNIFKSKEFKTICIVLLAVILTFLSIKIYNKINDNEVVFGTGKNTKYETSSMTYVINSIKALYTGEGTDAEIAGGESIVYMILNVMTMPVIYSLRLNVIMSMLLFIVVGILGLLFYFKKKKGYIPMLICVVLAFVFYIISLQVVYLISFSTDQMLKHSGADRYIETFLMAVLFFIFTMTIEFINRKLIKIKINSNKNKGKKLKEKNSKNKNVKKNKKEIAKRIKNKKFIIRTIKILFKDVCYFIVLVGVLIIVPKNYTMKNVVNINERNVEKTKTIRKIYEIMDTLNETGIPKDDDILLVSYLPEDALYFYMTRYYMFPMRIHSGGDIENYKSENLKKYEYVYIYNIKEEVDEDKINDITEPDTVLERNKLYKVNTNGKLENI